MSFIKEHHIKEDNDVIKKSKIKKKFKNDDKSNNNDIKLKNNYVKSRSRN